jgi:hypothetical protein
MIFGFLLDTPAFNQIIWREIPSIQPWIFIPYLESLSYPSKKFGLYRRKYKSDILQIALFALEQCEMHGQMHGGPLVALEVS